MRALTLAFLALSVFLVASNVVPVEDENTEIPEQVTEIRVEQQEKPKPKPVYKIDEGVIVGTDANFDQILEANEYVLVEFYAPWCGHCKKFAPDYSKAARTAKAKEIPVAVVKIDATENKATGGKYGVQGYPTLKFFHNGVVSDFKGERTATGVVKFLKRKTQPKCREVQNLEQFEEEILSTSAVVTFWADQSHKDFNVFQAVINDMNDDVTAIYTTDAETIERYKTEDHIMITMYKQFDEGRVDFEDQIEYDALSNFITEHQYPTVFDWQENLAEKLMNEDKPKYFLIYNGNGEENDKIKETFHKVARDLKGQAFFCYLDGSKESKMTDYLAVKTEEMPAVRIMSRGPKEIEKYKAKFALTYGNLADFLEDFKDGKYKPYKNSEPVPEDKGDAVKVVVGTTFRKIVLDPTKDVLIEFYAPWCGHCKKVAPELEKAAQKLKSIDRLVIAKMDATANEVEGINIQSYPTFYYYPAWKKESPVKEVQFDHNEEAILKWIKNNLPKKVVGNLEL